MIPANSLVRLGWRSRVEGVDCTNRLYFTNSAAFNEADFAAEAGALAPPVIDRIRSCMAIEATVTEVVVDLPEIRNVPPIVFGGISNGARLGTCLPAHFYCQVNWYGDLFGSGSLRNHMRLSGLSSVDFRSNHCIINFYSTVSFLFVYLRDTTNLGVTANMRQAVARRIGDNDYEFRPCLYRVLTTDLKSLKSRQR